MNGFGSKGRNCHFPSRGSHIQGQEDLYVGFFRDGWSDQCCPLYY